MNDAELERIRTRYEFRPYLDREGRWALIEQRDWDALCDEAEKSACQDENRRGEQWTAIRRTRLTGNSASV